MYPEARVNQWDYPCCVTVADQRQILCPVTNASKVRKTFKVGTCLGSYEKAKEVAEKVHTIIQNDLLPHTDQPGVEGDKEGKIRELLKMQDWSHLTEEDRKNHLTLITKHRITKHRKNSRSSSPY